MVILYLIAYGIYLLNSQLFQPSNSQYFFDDLLIVNHISQGTEIQIVVQAIQLLLFEPKFLKFNDPFDLIILCCLFGISCLISSNHMFIIVLSLQLINISMYFVLTIKEPNKKFKHEKVMSGALKYLLLSSFITIQLMLGSVLLFGNQGTMNLDYIQMIQNTISESNLIIWLAYIQIFSCIFFKQGLFPFHNWVIDIFTLSPLIAILILSTLPKIGVILFSINLNQVSILNTNILLVITSLSLVIGSIGMGSQKNLKRLIAFSSIANMGYLFLLIIGSSMIKVSNFIEIILFFIVNYMITFIVIFMQLINLVENKYFINKNLKSIILQITLFNLAGIPPMVGFQPKMYLLQMNLESGNILFHILSIIIISSTIGAGYYIREIKKNIMTPNLNLNNSTISFRDSIIISILITIIIMGLFIFLYFYKII